ncbi:3-oxoacyl-[acyl-carrier-protein] synthase, partial [Cladochytrium tenue]
GSSTLEVDPVAFCEAFFEAFPDAGCQTMTQEDVFHFLTICSYPWRKPVTFIPVLDDRFEFWLKKDSLWQSEDVNAVVGKDAGRVAILQGPVAVRHSTKVDEPVKDILSNIYTGHVQALKEKYYGGSDIAIPVVEYLGERPSASQSAMIAGLTSYDLSDSEGTTIMFEVTRNASDLPDAGAYFGRICGAEPSWLRAMLTTEAVVRGKSIVDNPVIPLMRPRPGQTVFVKLDSRRKPLVLSVYGSVQSKNAAVLLSIEGDTVTVSVKEKKGQSYVPLNFYFKYRPFQGYAPIHEVMEGRNQRIKDFYAALWDVPTSDLCACPTDKFTASFTVAREGLRNFVHAIGNKSELYTGVDPAIPMDYSISIAWRAVIAAILPKEIDGDLLRLVHLSNQFRVLSDEAIKAGDVIDSAAIINSVTINDSGKTVEVKAVLSKAGTHVMEITSSFLYRGKFTDYENTFRRSTESVYELTLKSVKDVAVLKSRKWVLWHENIPEIEVGSILTFCIESFARFKSATSFSEISTSGVILLVTTRETVEVGRVAYEGKDCVGNVVVEYLQRNGSSIEKDVFFANGGHSILPDTTIFPANIDAPAFNEEYARASGDLNPIHVNPYFADLANLPGTITHGMWTSAASRKFVEIFAAGNQPQRVKAYSVSFRGMVLPGDQLEARLSHVGMSSGKKLIKISTHNQRGELVLEGNAEVEQPATAYVFTGQGSQEVGMGMDLYAKSEVARKIWDRANEHMLSMYGVSILEIVRSNPKFKTVYFGGLKGAAIRQHYQAMTYDVVEDGQLKSLPLFPDITDDTASFTFKHPSGLLSATQFTQPALTLMEIASFQDMKANGLVQQNCAFAGHSLGEYAGLAAVGEVLSVESLVDVVFYRGMTMQIAVPRDSAGRSNYGMCAVNPLRVSNTFGEQPLQFVVNAIAHRSSSLLEIVNFNVKNLQYVVAGDLVNLEALRLTLNKVKSLNLNFVELVKTRTVEEIEEVLAEMVDESLAAARDRRAAAPGGIFAQERGVATIPLAGIDVPFHSSFLLSGVTPFREILRKKLQPRLLNVSLLVGKYIPNLTARLFNLSKPYFQEVYDLTGSSWLKQVLADWDDATAATPEGQQQLGYALLIELLAHQFASPVRWIETQDLLFQDMDVERLVEVGPSPVLSGMALRTLKIKYEVHDDAVTRRRTQLCTSKDQKEIYYEFEDAAAPEAEAEAPVPAAASAPAPASASPAATAAAPAPVAAAGPVADEPPTALEVLLVLIAQKLKKPLSDVPTSKSIKDLVGGKSTLQNEILGDLGAEFGNVLADKAEENPLSEVGSALQSSFSGSLGKTSTGLVNKMVSSKMPAGFGMGAVRSYMSSMFGLGPKRSDSALLHGLLSEPPARLASEAEAKTWIDSVVRSYAAKVGIAVGGGASSGSSGSSAAATVVTVNSEEFNLQRLKLDSLIRFQLEQFAKYLDIDLMDGAKAAATEREGRAAIQAELDLWSAEHGDFYAEGIKPAFTSLKARVFDSHWNWARQDALELYYGIVFGKITSVDRDLMNQ